MNDHAPGGLTLRPYQDEAISSSLSAIERAGRGLVVIPTGGGKTVVFSEIARRLGGRTLILVHRDELAKQALEAMRFVWPQATCGRVQGHRDEVGAQVVAASVPTLADPRRRARYLSRARPQLVIVDEAHHATAESWRGVIEALSPAPLLGVTATPERMDRADVSEIFGAPVYQIGMLELIAQGYLSDLRGLEVQTSLSMAGVRKTGGDFNAGDLARIVDVKNRNELAVRSWLRYAKGRRTIAFCASVSHAENLAAAFRDAGISAGAVVGRLSESERERRLGRLRSGEWDVVTSVGVLTEGFDEPRLSCVLLARPTLSRTLFSQMIGRGLRRFPGKADCLVLDMASVTSGLDAVGMGDLLGVPRTSWVSDALRRGGSVVEALRRRDGVTRLDDGVEIVAHEIDPLGASQMVWKGRGSGYGLRLADAGEIVLEDAGRGMMVATHVKRGEASRALTSEPVPVEWAVSVAEDEARRLLGGRTQLIERDAAWRTKEPTSDQIDTLTKAGVAIPATRGEASDAISSLAQGGGPGDEPTDKQREILEEHGIVVPATRGEASVLVGRIIDRRDTKKKPGGVRPPGGRGEPSTGAPTKPAGPETARRPRSGSRKKKEPPRPPSERQAGFLRSRGVSVPGTFAEAYTLISAIKENDTERAPSEVPAA